MPTGSSPVSSYVGGKLSMDEGVFKEALAVLSNPSNPANRTVSDQVYIGAVLIDYRQRDAESLRVGGTHPDTVRCPVCKTDLDHNYRVDAFQCGKCDRGFSLALMASMFFRDTVYKPANYWSSRPGKPAVIQPNPWAPSTYTPKLTSPAPKGTKAEDFNLDELKTEQEEPIVMYRAWSLKYDDISSLTSINKEAWPKQAPLVAKHHGSGECRSGKSPAWDCNCGIYGVKTLVQAQKWCTHHDSKQVQVLGKISCWGKVLMFETGAKVEFAYPLEIWLSKTWIEEADQDPEAIRKALTGAYAVPVRLEDGMFNLGLSYN